MGGFPEQYELFPRIERVAKAALNIFRIGVTPAMVYEPSPELEGRAMFEPNQTKGDIYYQQDFEDVEGYVFSEERDDVADREHTLGRLVMQKQISMEDAIAFDGVFGDTT